MKQRPALFSAIGLTFVLLAILGLSLTAQAAPDENIPARPQALLLNDDFDYGTIAMSLTIASGGNWVNTSGASLYVGYTTTSLSMAGYGSSGVGGAATISTGGTEDVNRSFTNQTSGTVYFAALVNVSAAGAGEYFLHLSTAGGFRPRVFAKDVTGTLSFGLSTTSATGTYSTAVFAYNTTYLVVAKYNVSTGDSALYVLDTFSAAEPATPLVSVAGTGSSAAQGIAIRQGSPAGARPAAVIDGVRVANTWADVVGYAPPQEADLGVAKSGPATASAGDPIDYTINISNSGNTTATLSILTDTLPTAVTFITYTTALPVSFSQPDAQTLVWNLGDVASSASGTITVQGVISSGLSGGTLFTNTVTASTTATETTTANNTFPFATLIGAPDLVVVKDGPDSVNAGDLVAYTLTYSNAGSLNASGVVLVDQLPAALTYVTDSLGTGVRVGNTITWSLGSLATNASGSLVLTATAGIFGDHANKAMISGALADSNPLNNTSTFTTTILGVDPYVQKSGPAQVFSGEVVSYTIIYGNHGNLPVAVTITDTLPISFTTSDIAFDGGPLNPIDTTNTRSWTATLQASDRFTFTLALTVPASIANNTHITNTIEITSTGLGNNPINDRSSASSTVYQIVPISVARAGTNGQVFGVEGQVIYAPTTFGTVEWGVQDASGGISVFFSPGISVTLGERMRLVATRGAFNNQEQLIAPVYYSATLGSGPQVQPIPYTTGQVASGSTEGWLAVVTGTVSSVPTVCTTNHQLNIDDGSGATTVFVDIDTGVNLCTLGLVNGDPLVVSGFSTQFGAVYEIKPRFPADVKRLFDVTFIYHDLEDAVLVGEDVQLRGDFTSWGTNPITMAHDANYTVFSATVTVPTTNTQGYKYYAASLGDPLAWDLLNTNDRSITPTQGVTIKHDYRNVVVGWGNLNGPASQTINLGSPTANIDGQLYVRNVTDPDGAGRSLKAEVGYGSSADPTSWSWFATTYITNTGNNDVYGGVITPTAGGIYSYAMRYNGNWGVGNLNSTWVYADLNGIPFSLDQAGVLTVTAPQLALNKAVATTHTPAELGEVVTYTLTLSNSGDGTATGAIITDALPIEVTFGSFVQQSGATFSSGTVSWSGSLTANTQTQIVFTATVGINPGYAGRVVTNTVSMTADNAPGQAANAVFSIFGAPQLAITKTVATAHTPVQLGDPITYTIIVANSGQGNASGVIITDVLPAGVSGSDLSQTVDINAGQQATFEIVATVTNNTALYGQTVTNTAQYQHGSGSGSASAAFTIATAPQLAITKTVATAHTPVQLGDPITYTIVVANSGQANASGVVITDVLPAGVSGSNLNQTVNINAGQQATFEIVAAVTNNTALYGQTITNTAHYQHASGNGSASAAFTIATAPQLAITKTVATMRTPVQLGDPITYTVVVANSGQANASGVVITDVLPAGVSGSNLNQTVTINAGQQATFAITATVTNNTAFSGQTVTNTAHYQHASSNGSSSAAFTIVSVPNLTTSTKVASATGTVLPGALVTYTVTLNNTGGVTATARITDVIGSYYTVYQALDFTQSPTGTLTWTGVIAAGQSVTLRFVAQVKSLAQLPVGQTTLANSVTVNDGVHVPFVVSTSSAPNIRVYGNYLPLIQR